MSPKTTDYHLHVRNYGGTISCSEYLAETGKLYDPTIHGAKEDNQIEYLPEKGKIEYLILNSVSEAIRNLFGEDGQNIIFSEASAIKDSAEYTTQDLMQIVSDVRRILHEDILNGYSERSLLLATGTDTAASVAHVLAEGIRPEDLRGRAVGLVVSNDHVAYDNPASDKHSAIVSLTNGMYLVTRPGAHGRVGVCNGGNYYAPRGLRKVSTKGNNNFKGRFPVIAEADEGPVPKWAFTSRKEQPQPYEAGRGREHEFALENGIECMQLVPTCNYANIKPFIEGACTNTRGEFSGLILIAPGDANLRKGATDLVHIAIATELAAEAGIPVMVVADPLRPEVIGEDITPKKNNSAGYSGSFSNIRRILDDYSSTGKTFLIDGGELTVTEATLLMSAAVARAKNQHNYTKDKIVEYVRKCIKDYQEDIG